MAAAPCAGAAARRTSLGALLLAATLAAAGQLPGEPGDTLGDVRYMTCTGPARCTFRLPPGHPRHAQPISVRIRGLPDEVSPGRVDDAIGRLRQVLETSIHQRKRIALHGIERDGGTGFVAAVSVNGRDVRELLDARDFGALPDS